MDSRTQLDGWFQRVAGDGSDPRLCLPHDRHDLQRGSDPHAEVLTLDTGEKLRKMVNVNHATEAALRAALAAALSEADPNTVGLTDKVLPNRR